MIRSFTLMLNFIKIATKMISNRNLLIFFAALFVAADLVAQTPTITGFTPKRGSVGTTITITGTNFSPVTTSNFVFFGAVKSPVLTATATTITVKVPAGATYKRISVTTSGLTAWTREYFLPSFAGTGELDYSSFAENVDFSGTMSDPRICDLDGDGKPDVLGFSNNTISLFRNTSTPGSVSASSFAAPENILLSTANSHHFDDVIIADVDNDMKPDIVTVNYQIVPATGLSRATLTVYKNNNLPGSLNSGGFDLPVVIDFPIKVPSLYSSGSISFRANLNSADINLDGLEDIVIAQTTSTFLTGGIWVATETGIFQNSIAGPITPASFTYTGYSSGAHETTSIFTGNYNVDNKPDILLWTQHWYLYASPNTYSWRAYQDTHRNSSPTGGAIGGGSMTLAYSNNFVSQYYYQVQLADWNLDGKNDLFYGNSIQQNNITGVVFSWSDLGSAVSTGSTSATTKPKAFADLNGDGKPDLVGSKLSAGIIEVVPNTHASGAISASSFGTAVKLATYGGTPGGVECVDIDGDGKPDIIYNSGGLSVMRNLVPSTGAIVTIGTTSASVGGSVSLPVTASSLTDITSFQFTINYDAAKLDFTGTSGWAAGINGASVQVNDNNAGQVTFVYNDVSFNIASGTFFNLSFNVLNAPAGNTPVTWGDVPTPREFSNSVPNILSITYNNGSVTTVGSLYSITGVITYDNVVNTPMTAIPVVLKNNAGVPVANTTTSGTGGYSFGSLPNGNYSIELSTTKPWGGVTTMDVTIYKKHIGNVPGFILSGLRLQSGDVDASTTLTAVDLTLIKQRIGAQISSFASGDWRFEASAVTVNGANVTRNIKAICSGDGNGSYIP